MRNQLAETTTPILFVDDEPETKRAFARAMGARGFDVDVAEATWLSA